MNADSRGNGQQEVIAFLATPAAYGLPNDTPIERVDTHISVVWLVGRRAYKLKRAVRYDYVDFSTAELRHAACEAEVRLNRRTAPGLYLGVQAITREIDGGLALGGQGQTVDWVVEMVRFDQDSLFDRMAQQQRLDLNLMDGVADAVAHLHIFAETRTDRGGRDGMAWVIDGNGLAFADPGMVDFRPLTERITTGAENLLSRDRDLLDRRRQDGFVRLCHGDLHLRNICLVEGVPTLFDCVEFNDQISCIDVLYDLAFLLMDLWRRQLPAHANVVFNRYLEQTVDVGGLALLPLFLSCRAAIRAKTSAASARVQTETGPKTEWMGAVSDYLVLSESFLTAPPPILMAIGGFSGSGKSTVARALAPHIGAPPGALILRTDVIRKREFAVDPLTHLGPDAYTSSVNDRVYRIITQRARTALSAGQTVIADAVHGHAGARRAVATVARERGLPFFGIWLEAPTPLLQNRLAKRRADASDATDAVLELQIRSATVPDDWHRLDASLPVEEIRRRIEMIVRLNRAC